MNRIATIAVGLLTFAAGLVLVAPAGAAGTVTISGNALSAFLIEETLAISGEKAVGADVYIAEKPELRTTTDAEGFWSLEVPDRTSITPCIEHGSSHPMCDQTFYTSGQDLRMVNFQTVVETISDLLATFSGATTVTLPSGHIRVRDCAVVSTIYRWEKRFPADYDEFMGNAPHGVAGATATLTDTRTGEAVGEPIYYNESVIPSKLLTESTQDGGVMWVDLPPGTYTLTASKPGARFAPVQVTCEEGRLVNASPVWGLYELAPTEEPNPAVFPAPTVPRVEDTRVDAMVLSSRITRSGKRRALKVRIKAGEKVTVKIEARQGKRRVTSGSRKIAASTRTIQVPLRRAFRRGSLALTIRMKDGAGNSANSRSRLFVPGPGPRRR